VGVVIEDKDYLSAQLAAARMFATTKSIEPDVLLSLLMEEADQMKAQSACRRVSGKGSDKDKGEALQSSEVSKPRKGRGRENISCWSCEEVGHYSCECKKPKKAKDVEMKAPGMSASAVEPDEECEGAWATELVEDAINEGSGLVLLIPEINWFEEAVAMMDAKKIVIAEEIPHEDWFHEVAEDDDESEDEGASSGSDCQGYPGVFQLYPYPTLHKPLPLSRVWIFSGLG